ncbi:hypothetical protein LIER_35615 [Lithospermum erythrorhizon]|uniref:Leucine-rich repeat-containing N-terminal plant-type domain-containing protein n=1 Tax=Lithospermum erythrorhizon TaxID=34254 RepID=A0AAV3NV51_LITER
MFSINELLIMFLFLCLLSFSNGEHGITNNTPCLVVEREALLGFKKGLIDPSSRLSSWEGENCCHYRGVDCSNITVSRGLHATELDLRGVYYISEYTPDRSRLRGKVIIRHGPSKRIGMKIEFH